MSMIKYVCLVIMCCGVMTACSDEGAASKETNSAIAGKKTAKEVFISRCMACHGDESIHGIGNAPDLSISRLNKTAIFQVIQNGRGGMPSFKTVMTKNEIKEITEYIFSSQNK